LQTFHKGFERFEELKGTRFDRLEAPSRRLEFEPGDSALLTEIAEHRERFLAAMDDDFNTGGALGELFEMMHALNRTANTLDPRDTKRLDEYRRGIVVLKELTQILGLFRKLSDAEAHDPDANARLVDDLLGYLVGLRKQARAAKDYARADEIRKTLAGFGVELVDQADGTTKFSINREP
jgi:cysteinyl-tRNA synthetase